MSLLFLDFYKTWLRFSWISKLYILTIFSSSQDVFQGGLEELLLHECDLCVRQGHPLKRLRPLKLKAGIVNRSSRLHPHRGEGRLGEDPGRLGLDATEAEAAGQMNRPADQVGRDPLAPVLHFHPDHPDVEELVRDDLVKEVLVLLPQLVMDCLDRPVPQLSHSAKLIFKTHLPILSQDTIIHCSAHSSTSLVICYWCEIFGKFLLDHPVHVLQAVEPLAEAQVLGEGLIGVVGGVQQLVHSVQVIWTHDGKSQSCPQILAPV